MVTDRTLITRRRTPVLVGVLISTLLSTIAHSPNSGHHLEKLFHFFWKESHFPLVLPGSLPHGSPLLSYQPLGLNLLTCCNRGAFVLGWLLPPYADGRWSLFGHQFLLATSGSPKECLNDLQATGKVLVLVCAHGELFQFFRKGVSSEGEELVFAKKRLERKRKLRPSEAQPGDKVQWRWEGREMSGRCVRRTDAILGRIPHLVLSTGVGPAEVVT